MTNNDKQLEDILYGLIELEELGDDQIVAAVKNHPEHRDAILSFYEAWLTDDDGRRTHALAENEPEYVPDISGLWAQRAEIPDPFLNQPAMALRGSRSDAKFHCRSSLHWRSGASRRRQSRYF